jgi:hypothetical protein
MGTMSEGQYLRVLETMRQLRGDDVVNAAETIARLSELADVRGRLVEVLKAQIEERDEMIASLRGVNAELDQACIGSKEAVAAAFRALDSMQVARDVALRALNARSEADEATARAVKGERRHQC